MIIYGKDWLVHSGCSLSLRNMSRKPIKYALSSGILPPPCPKRPIKRKGEREREGGRERERDRERPRERDLSSTKNKTNYYWSKYCLKRYVLRLVLNAGREEL